MGTAKTWERFKPLPANIQSALKQLPAFFDNTDAKLVYLFGSLAEKAQGRDVDLAILTEKTPPYRFRAELTAALGTERLDIVDLRRASPAFCFDIIQAGKLLYAANHEVQLQFELGVVRRYHDTAYLRRRQEEGLKRRMAAWSSNTAVS